MSIAQVHPDIALDQLDNLITCQLPTNNDVLRQKVIDLMTHKSNHLTRETSRCNRGGKCIYGFPHPITPQTYVDDEGRVHYKRLTEEERWIAPHVPEFIDMFDCHIYWDVVSTVHVFMYLYKYMFKGPDRTRFHVQDGPQLTVNEAKEYVEGRYLSATEAAWRILSFDITSKEPSVTCLPVHLPGQNIPQFGQGDREHSSVSLLMCYFHRPHLPQFANLLYVDYFERFNRYKLQHGQEPAAGEFLEVPFNRRDRYKITARQHNLEHVARIQFLSPALGEVFYLRALLAHRPAVSFEDLRTINGRQYDTYQEAAKELGLFQNTNEGFYTMEEAVVSLQPPSQLRFLFSRIIMEGYPALQLWEHFRRDIALDCIVSLGSEEAGFTRCLRHLGVLLGECGKRLSDFGLPEPEIEEQWNEVEEELNVFAPRRRLLTDRGQQMKATMSLDQRSVYDRVSAYINGEPQQAGPLFVEGKPGRGKMFLIDALCAQLRGDARLVMVVATSALAAAIYERGRTAHSLFKIPVTEVRIKSSNCLCH